MKTTLSDLPSIETWIHKHRITSTVVETKFQNIPGSKPPTTGPPRQLKRLHPVFPALKQESTSISQPLHLCKLNFSTFLAPKHVRTSSTTLKTAFSYLPSIKTGVYEHRNTSALKWAYVSFTGLPRQWEHLHLNYRPLNQASTSIAWCLQLWKLNFRTWKLNCSTFQASKHACTTSTIEKTDLSDLPSTKTGVHEHRKIAALKRAYISLYENIFS